MHLTAVWALIIRNRLFYFLKWDAKRDPLTGKKMRKPIELDDRIHIAKDLHKRFHEALGVGDMKALQPICCEGLLATARTRIDQRKIMRRSSEYWQLMSYDGNDYVSWLNKWPLSSVLPRAAARVVADRVAPLPFADTHIRQCTVRIRSFQHYRLASMDKGQIVKHTDYVLIQKMTTKGEEGPWKIWGLTEPTTLEEIDKTLSGKMKDAGITMKERITNKIAALASR